MNIKDINYDRILEIGKQFYGNAKDFTFYFVGTTDGLFRFVEKSGLFIRMDGDNRLPGTYTIGAVYGSRTSLYLGSSRGVVCINVGNIPDKPLYKAVSFTSLTLTNGRRPFYRQRPQRRYRQHSPVS